MVYDDSTSLKQTAEKLNIPAGFLQRAARQKLFIPRDRVDGIRRAIKDKHPGGVYDPAIIQQVYDEEKLSIHQVAEKLGVGWSTIQNYARKGLFKPRSLSEAGIIQNSRRIMTPERLEKYRQAGRKGGKKSAAVQSEQRRSRHERMFFDLVKRDFIDAVPNTCMFEGWDADVIIPSRRLAIHWNGNWHYLPIISEAYLTRVQQRDKLKQAAIMRCGYTNYVIEDRNTKLNEVFVNEQYVKFRHFIRGD